MESKGNPKYIVNVFSVKVINRKTNEVIFEAENCTDKDIRIDIHRETTEEITGDEIYGR